MRTNLPGAGRWTALPPPHSLVMASLAAGLAATLSCTDAPTAPANIRNGTPVFLNATAAAAVRTVLADIAFRVDDAIEDAAVRASFATALTALASRVEAGLLDDADQCAANARAALSQAASQDGDGSGDADRSAIGLALDVAAEEIQNARLAAGGVK